MSTISELKGDAFAAHMTRDEMSSFGGSGLFVYADVRRPFSFIYAMRKRLTGEGMKEIMEEVVAPVCKAEVLAQFEGE